jgi:ATP-binding cassette subfamily C protein LapB
MECLPAIALLKTDEACVVLSIDLMAAEVVVKHWEGQEGKQAIKLAEFKRAYAGKMLLIEPSDIYEKRVDEARLFQKKKSWFWGVFFQFKSFYTPVILSAFIINIFALVSPLFVMNVYDRVVPNYEI